MKTLSEWMLLTEPVFGHHPNGDLIIISPEKNARRNTYIKAGNFNDSGNTIWPKIATLDKLLVTNDWVEVNPEVYYD